MATSINDEAAIEAQWKHHIDKELQCYCKKKAVFYTTKKGEPWVKCGVQVDYKALTDDLKSCKTKEDKKAAYSHHPLGCKFNMKLETYKGINHEVYALHPSQHPKCYGHNMLMKLQVSTSVKNKGRNFFACAVDCPDYPCDSFQWFDSLAELRLDEEPNYDAIRTVQDLSPHMYNPVLEIAVKGANTTAEKKSS